MKRIPELAGLPEHIQKMCEIPDGCKVYKVTNKWDKGGPVVVSYENIEKNPEEVKRNRAALDDAIDRAVRKLADKEAAKYEASLILQGGQ